MLVLFVTFQIIRYTLRSIFAKILLVFFIFSFLLYHFSPSFALFHVIFRNFAILNFFYFIIQPIFISVEESLHMGICIQNGKSKSIVGLGITYFVIKRNHLILIISVASKFQRNIELSKKIQIHGGAPLLILLFLCIIITLILPITTIPIKTLVLFWLILSVFPISSLIPFKFIFETDGYCILKDAKHLKFPKPKLIRELLCGIFYGLRYIFLGSKHTKKCGIEVANARIVNAFNWVQKGEFENALNKLEEELKNDNNNPELYNNTAWCYCELGTKIYRAITLVKKAIELNPDEATYYDTLSWCYFKKGDINKAKHFLSKAISIEPYNSIFQSHLRKIVKKSSNLLLDKE